MSIVPWPPASTAMPKKAKELTPLAVKRLHTPGLHAVGGVSGLHLQISCNGARSWIIRITVGTRRRDMGLGGFPDVQLAEARAKARAVRADVKNGVDPVAAREAARLALKTHQRSNISFKAAAHEYVSLHASAWRNSKHKQQWRNTLETYAFPHIGNKDVRDICINDLVTILVPIWTTKTETATRLRGRIEVILAWATVRGYRTGENPAKWGGNLATILPKPKMVAEITHHPALPASEIPAFMMRLKTQKFMAAYALQFLILSAARSGEVLGATWEEINFETRVWTIPAKRMKAGKEHRVPLTFAALELLNTLPGAHLRKGGFIFKSPRGGKLSDMAMTQLLRRMKIPAVPHGFRSTFRDWVAEKTNFSSDVAEMALAHKIPSKVEAAYRRGDLFEKRYSMMTAWSQYVLGRRCD